MLGDWLARKWYQCQGRKHEALTALAVLKIPMATLREKWSQQVQAQTKPAPRESPTLFILSHAATSPLEGCSKNLGRQEVEAILALEESLKTHQKAVRDLEGQLAKESTLGLDVVEVAACNWLQ
jgi:hypothetical protein